MNLKSQFIAVQKASRKLGLLTSEQINAVLVDLSEHLLANSEDILAANEKDCTRMDKANPKYDRLKLTQERLESIAADLKNIAGLPSPLGKILEQRTLPSGLELKHISVPLGVIGIIYEARPNVTFDVFSLCFKSGNACILKGGSDAKESNAAIVKCIHEVLKKHNISTDVAFLMPPEREHVKTLLEAKGLVDVVIPRGSQKLIDFVTANAKIPVIETGAGIVHTYFDESAKTDAGAEIIFNAKTRRPSVCNSLDCLIIHESRVADLAKLTAQLAEKDVLIYADDAAHAALDGHYSNLDRASEEHFGTEFLSLKMSIKTVANLSEALAHIAKYSSKHSEAILSENEKNIERFLNEVDAAAVYANASTAFTDGAQFGLGAEIGISTQKLHARGPMGLEQLTSTKWVLRGTGQIRN